MSDHAADQANLFPKAPGDRLRDAREAAGLTLADVAARTRVPQRHLEAIESNDYKALPSATYAVGFAKAYARAVGADEVGIGRDIRAGLGTLPRAEAPYQPFQLAEPARIPSAGLVYGGVAIAVLIVLGALLWYGSSWFGSRGSAPTAAPTASVATAPAQTPPPPPRAAAAPGAPVTITANDQVWVRVYDATNKTLLLSTMKPGETYTVPADASGPMINVGRPDKLTIKVGGQAIPPLGNGKRPIKDVPLTASALLARAGGPAVATPAAPTPSPGASAAVPPFFQSGGAPSAAPTHTP